MNCAFDWVSVLVRIVRSIYRVAVCALLASPQLIIDARLCRPLVLLLRHPAERVLTPARCVIDNIADGFHGANSQAIIDAGALDALASLLQSPKCAFRTSACRVISNSVAWNEERAQAVMEASVLPLLVEVLASEAENNELRMHALRAISNVAASASCRQIARIADCGVLPLLCQHLQRVLDDPTYAQLAKVAINCVERVRLVGDLLRGPRCCASLYLGVCACFRFARYTCMRSVGSTGNWCLPGSARLLRSCLHTRPRMFRRAQCVWHPTSCRSTTCRRRLCAQLMHSASEQSRWDASVLIANIAAGTQEQLRAVVDANVLRLALEALSTVYSPPYARVTALLPISSAMGSWLPRQLHHAADAGILPLMCALLSMLDVDPAIVVLKCIAEMLTLGHEEALARGLRENPYAMSLRDCGATGRVDHLLRHGKPEAREHASKLLGYVAVSTYPSAVPFTGR